MKLHASSPSALNTFSGYGDGYVLVNGQRHESNLIVTPEQLLPWSVASFDALVEDLAKSLDKFNVPAREKRESLAMLYQMRNAIVGH